MDTIGPHAPITLLLASLLALPGCLSTTTHLQPIDESVRAVVVGRDCIPILLGIAAGTTTIERAKTSNLRWMFARWSDVVWPVLTPVARVRSLALTDDYFLIAGARCIEVTGEPK